MRAHALLLSLAALMAQAHESPIDHVERELDLSVKEGQLCLDYRLHYTDRTLVMQLMEMDANNDGRLSDEERTAYFSAQAAKLADLFIVQVEGRPLRFKPVGAMRPDGRLDQTYAFTAPLGSLAPGRHPGLFVDGYSRMFPGPFRWRQLGAVGSIRVEPLTETSETKVQEHPMWLELKFAIVVP